MAPNCSILAIKRVNLIDQDQQSRASFLQEIELLSRLQEYPNIIQLIDSELESNGDYLDIVLEYAETDLAKLLSRHKVFFREKL